jgi:hypothetical protein
MREQRIYANPNRETSPRDAGRHTSRDSWSRIRSTSRQEFGSSERRQFGKEILDAAFISLRIFMERSRCEEFINLGSLRKPERLDESYTC